MTDKTIHIVFQVLNYLVSDDAKTLSLLPIDKLILIVLAKHHGEVGIFPNQKTIATKIHCSLRYTKNRIKHLESTGLISIKRLNRKNYYFLDFLENTGDPQITHPSPTQISIGDPQITSKVIHRSPHRGSIDHTNNPLSNPFKKTERAATKRATPLTDDFLPNQSAVDKAQELGLTQDEANEEFDKFMLHYQAKGTKSEDWDSVLKKWFVQGATYKRKERTAPKQDEVRSTVPWFNGHDPLRALDIVKKVLPKLNGGKPNGLGSDGEREA